MNILTGKLSFPGNFSDEGVIYPADKMHTGMILLMNNKDFHQL